MRVVAGPFLCALGACLIIQIKATLLVIGVTEFQTKREPSRLTDLPKVRQLIVTNPDQDPVNQFPHSIFAAFVISKAYFTFSYAPHPILYLCGRLSFGINTMRQPRIYLQLHKHRGSHNRLLLGNLQPCKSGPGRISNIMTGNSIFSSQDHQLCQDVYRCAQSKLKMVHHRTEGNICIYQPIRTGLICMVTGILWYTKAKRGGSKIKTPQPFVAPRQLVLLPPLQTSSLQCAY